MLLVGLPLAWAATAYGRAGQWNEGIRAADEGIALAAEGLGGVFAAELWRVKGTLLIGQARARARSSAARLEAAVQAAGQCFHRALDIAREQGARALQLRTALSLAALPLAGDERRRAHELVRSLRASFTEGLDTRDLQDAQALLDEVDRPVARADHRRRRA